jgi:hypothetical protein
LGDVGKNEGLMLIWIFEKKYGIRKWIELNRFSIGSSGWIW